MYKLLHRKLLDWFFDAYSFKNEFESKRAESLLYITITVGIFFICIGIVQRTLDMENIIIVGTAIGLAGIGITLLLIKFGKLYYAGDTLVLVCLIVICVADLYDDWKSPLKQNQYKIYVSLVSLLGTYILCLAFLRNQLKFYIYAVIGAIVFSAHAGIIYFHPLHDEFIRRDLWVHYITGLGGIIISALIFNFIMASREKLLEQNIAFAEKLRQQNEDLEQTVAQRTRALKASNENLQEFAYVVSHDLKEPLRTISGFVSIIEKKLSANQNIDNDLREYIQYVIKGTRQMDELIHDLLEYSRLNLSNHEFVPTNTREVVSEVLNSLSGAISDTNAQIEIHALPNVYSKHALVFQLFQNLISNAIKYRKNGIQPVISIGAEEKDNEAIFYVKDNGQGIPTEYYHTVFQAFKRLHTKAEYEGTGIGLAICKKIVDLHNGRIWINSIVGEGTTFYFTLPKS